MKKKKYLRVLTPILHENYFLSIIAVHKEVIIQQAILVLDCLLGELSFTTHNIYFQQDKQH